MVGTNLLFLEIRGDSALSCLVGSFCYCFDLLLSCIGIFGCSGFYNVPSRVQFQWFLEFVDRAIDNAEGILEIFISVCSSGMC